MSNARWAKSDTLHTTLRFFGDTSDAQQQALEALVKALAKELVSAGSAITVRAPAVHGFPDPTAAHVLVLDIEDEAHVLAGLAARAEAAAVSLGFAREERSYHAHLTLARMRKAMDVTPFVAEAAALPPGTATAITLYASRSGPSGAVYVPLARAALS